jgi:16S rRNA (adenine1518-N6/adenine1519-N6)-dimethyltransferase
MRAHSSTKQKVKKSLGQHFLMHARIAERIADTAPVTREDVVFEIGPGTGMLTRALLARAKKVIALETDRTLHEKLSVDFAAEIALGRLKLIFGDIRTFDFATLPKKYIVVANIPYYITGEIIRLLLEASTQPHSVTLLVQKEVAARIARSKKESILSLSIKVYGTPTYEFTVPRGAFLPAPKVDSAVLSIRSISRKNFKNTSEETHFFDLIKTGFAHKRKLLAKNLTAFGLPPNALPPKARAEDLSTQDWLALAQRDRN